VVEVYALLIGRDPAVVALPVQMTLRVLAADAAHGRPRR